ncbi:MAG: hypothetical protein H7326_03400, partial [Bdellovibrionaceae bacterium]|nr:hypothetical protein [Pseudobdellovibrionaceae bacterium]
MNSILCPRAFCRFLLLTLLTVLVPYFVMAATSQNETPVLPGTLGVWMDAEARLNDKEGLGAPPRDHLALNDEFRAENEKWFRVPSYWIPESALETAEADALIPRDLKAELYRYRKGQREFRLFVHPQSTEFYKNFVNRYPRADDGLARATASSRSVLMTLSNNTQVFFFAKLSLDLNLGYHDRTIPATEAIRSVGTSIY